MDNKKRLIIMGVTAGLLLLCGIVGFTYAWFSAIIEGSGKPITVTSGKLDIKYVDSKLMNVPVGEPIYDSKRATRSYTNNFDISHNSTSTITNACYKIEFSVDSIQDKFKSEFLKWELYNLSTGYIVSSGNFADAAAGGLVPIARGISLPNGEVHSYQFRVWLSYSETEDQSDLLIGNSGNALTGHMVVTSNTGECQSSTLADKILLDNTNVSTRTTFDGVFTTNNNGNTIYRANGQNALFTYYFAGKVTNNYVVFGGYYWRIVRINEDRSVRLLYAGEVEGEDSAYIGRSKFNSASGPASVGYMYTANAQHGVGTSSDIKLYLEDWYENRLIDYDSFVSKTAIYCNNRDLQSGYSWSTTNSFYYHGNTVLSGTPSFICNTLNDRFSVSTANGGNGALDQPIGLITFDEVKYAGGSNAMNADYYISENANVASDNWWTMTPIFSNGGSAPFTWIGMIYNSYTVGAYNVLQTMPGVMQVTGANTSNFKVRPVISLKGCADWLGGNGTIDSPYTVTVSSTCRTAEN